MFVSIFVYPLIILLDLLVIAFFCEFHSVTDMHRILLEYGSRNYLTGLEYLLSLLNCASGACVRILRLGLKSTLDVDHTQEH